MTYPLEIFIACGRNSIEGLDAGVYHYRLSEHALAQHHPEDVRPELARAAQNQKYTYQAPLDIVICAEYERTTRRYGSRGERYVHIEVGHAGQNIYLQATALGLGTVAIGAFHDEAVRAALRLEKQYQPLYIMPVGKPAALAVGLDQFLKSHLTVHRVFRQLRHEMHRFRDLVAGKILPAVLSYFLLGGLLPLF